MAIKVSVAVKEKVRVDIEGEIDYIKQNIPHIKEIVETLKTNKVISDAGEPLILREGL